MSTSWGLTSRLSALVGTSEPALRLLLTVLAGYPLALLHRKYIYGKNANTQHFFAILSGFTLGYLNYGLEMFHPVTAILITYLILSIVGGSALSVALTFIFNLAYLLTGYCVSGTDDYDINWTMPQCILVLRLIGVAYDLYDGQQPIEKLSKENQKVALRDRPNVLEFFAFSLFPASFMVGPQFPLKRYQQFVSGDFSDNEKPPDCVKYGLMRFSLGVIYLAIFQVLGLMVSDDYLVSSEFYDLGYFKKLVLMGMWGRFTLYKYISCWLLTEGACILFGLAHNGVDTESGQVRWNGLENVKLSIFENTTEFNDYILSFNINTNHWVAQYVYKRLKFMGNRHISQLAVLLFLAIWHGFHSGYYVCFFFEFIIVVMERDVKSIVNNNESLSMFFSQSWVRLVSHVLLRIYTFVFMGWCLFPFALLHFEKYWAAFGAMYHVGTIFFVPYLVLYSPLLKMVFKKTKKTNKDS